jgi:hypothetical protein
METIGDTPQPIGGLPYGMHDRDQYQRR